VNNGVSLHSGLFGTASAQTLATPIFFWKDWPGVGRYEGHYQQTAESDVGWIWRVRVNFCYLYEGLAGTRMLGYEKANNEDACVIALQF
jgi:hypothetical protein